MDLWFEPRDIHLPKWDAGLVLHEVVLRWAITHGEARLRRGRNHHGVAEFDRAAADRSVDDACLLAERELCVSAEGVLEQFAWGCVSDDFEFDPSVVV